MPFEKGNPYRFEKGHEGMGGRPTVSIKDTIRKYMEEKVKDVDPVLIQMLVGKNEDFAKQYGDMKLRDAYAISLIRRGLRGDFELLSYLEGKPAQNVNLGGQEDNPIKIEIEYVDAKPEEDET